MAVCSVHLGKISQIDSLERSYEGVLSSGLFEKKHDVTYFTYASFPYLLVFRYKSCIEGKVNGKKMRILMILNLAMIVT